MNSINARSLLWGMLKFVLPLFVIMLIQTRLNAQPAPSSVPCAGEGEVCKFEGTREVKYGANGVFYSKTLTGGAVCNTTTFGGDPVEMVLKRCYLVYEPVRMPGAARDIDAKNGAVWMIGTAAVDADYEIYQLSGSNWTKVDGAARRIAVDNNGKPWVITSIGMIFRRDNDSWTVIPGPNGVTPVDIAISNSGEVWIVNDIGSVSRWTGSGWTTLISLAAKKVIFTPAPDTFQIVDENGKRFVRESATSWVNSADVSGLADQYSEYAVDANGISWGVDSSFGIWKLGGSSSAPSVATNPPTGSNPAPSVASNPPAGESVETTSPASSGMPNVDEVPDVFLPNAPRVITTWNKAGYLTLTRVYRLDDPNNPVFLASDGPPNHMAGEHPDITVGAEVPMSTPLQVRIYTLVGIGEAVESFRGTLGVNVPGGCYSARGTTMKPIVEPCQDAISVEARHITFKNEAGFTAEMFLTYFVNQTENGVSLPIQKMTSSGLTSLGYRRKVYVPDDALPNMPVTLSIKAYGTNNEDLFTQNFDLTRQESPCYEVRGLLLNPSSQACAGEDAYLTDENKVRYESYDGIPSVLSDADMQLVMNWIAAKMTVQMSPFCWKPSYDNGAGVPIDRCAPGQEQVGLLCYSECQAGYVGSLDRCGRICPEGFADIGFFCQKPAPYGRGAGYAWQFGDPLNDSGSMARCEADNGAGNCEGSVIIYPKCKSGYHAFGANICTPDCPADWADTGTGCTKPTYYRGAGEPLGCPSGYEKSGQVCYPACKPGYEATVTRCTLKCPSQQNWDCGAACAIDQLECGMTVGNQVISPIMMVITIATLGAAEEVEGPLNEAETGAREAVVASRGTSKLTKAYQFVKETVAAQKANFIEGIGGEARYNKIFGNTLKGISANFPGDGGLLELLGEAKLKSLNELRDLKKGIVSAVGGEEEFDRLFNVKDAVAANFTGDFNGRSALKVWTQDLETSVKCSKILLKAILAVKRQTEIYNMTFADNFESMTSKEINEMINTKFPNPAGQYQVKRQWAIQNLGMLNTASSGNLFSPTQWAETQASWNVGSIIDPSGLTSTIAAYYHPLCGDDVQFPAQVKLLHSK